MRKLKVLLLSGAVFMLTIATANAKPQSYRGTHTASEEFKFGLQSRSILFQKFGLFGEYTINPNLGLQAAVIHFWDLYFMSNVEGENGKHALVVPRYVAMPITLRVYPTKDGQLGLFGGLHVGYLVGGQVNYSTVLSENTSEVWSSFRETQEDEFKSLKEESQTKKINSFGLSYIIGFDYEFTSGFIMGVEHSRGLLSLMECKNTFLNWTLQLAFGYNFAKLI